MTSVSPTPSPPDRDLGSARTAGPATVGGPLAGVDHRPDRADQPTVVEPEVIDLRKSRLAELVAGLTGCEPAGALHAIRSSSDTDSGDALEVVARAMVDVDQPVPEGFRVAGYLRRDLPLAHHGSLRRWERGGAPAEPDDDRRS